MNQLFSPLKLNSKVILANRLVVAPMTTVQSNADGTISENELAWLERLAKDNYGMVLSCAVAISPESIAFPNQLSAAADDKIPGLTKLAQRANQAGGHTIVQLCHGGSRANTQVSGLKSYSASSYAIPKIPNFPDFIVPKELTIEHIKSIVDEFAAACVRIEKAGFAGVEMHGANGYLFTQFFSTMSNLRSDDYGGSLENRARFAREVIQECRRRVSADFIIGFRMTFENSFVESGLDVDENIQIANWLTKDGINYLHTSQIDYRAKSLKYPEKILLSYLRQQINHHLPLIGVGGVFDAAAAARALEYGADLVAIGRAAIGNVNLPGLFAGNHALPYSLPYDRSHLEQLGLPSQFIDYLQNQLAMLNIVK